MKHQAEGVTELVVTGAGARTHGKKSLCASLSSFLLLVRSAMLSA